ncbi:MAG TPA: metalloregulator ArsR/SmtB family transcription factor [Vicinamibacteria bacterium]|nr:metalloregulator ArsR/SmtB family transcription factor [Vicinamibacteria bacterium]
MRVAPQSDVFHAIADPTRRRILELLRDGDRPVQDLVTRVDVTFGAVSQHLKTLRESGLVSCRKDGRRRIYRLQAEPLRQIHDWTAVYQKAWRRRFRKLRTHLEGDS